MALPREPAKETIWVLGVDPDTSTPGIALLRRCQGDTASTVMGVRTLRADGLQELSQEMPQQLYSLFSSYMDANHYPPLMIVEGQRIWSGSKASRKDILYLAQAAGVAIACASNLLPHARLYVPDPSEWKGEVDKKIHQPRIMSRVNWPNFDDLKKQYGARINHVIDAVGLADWGIENYGRIMRSDRERP